MQQGSIWLTLRNCGCCHRPIEQRRDISRDHFWPRSFGGHDSPNNIWEVHRQCNTAKRNRMPTAKETLRFSQLKGFCRL